MDGITLRSKSVRQRELLWLVLELIRRREASLWKGGISNKMTLQQKCKDTQCHAARVDSVFNDVKRFFREGVGCYTLFISLVGCGEMLHHVGVDESKDELLKQLKARRM